MAYTELKLDKIVDQVANAFGKQFRRSAALVANVSKVAIPKGTNSIKIPIPASLTASKRTAGSAAIAGATPAPTSATITANTEYSTAILIDQLDSVGSQYSISDFEATNAADAIIGSLNTDTWTEVNGLSNDVGTAGTVPTINILNKAWTQLFNEKVPAQSNLIAVIGGAEYEAWKDAMTVNEDGVLGSGVKYEGKLPRAYGFSIFPDQQRLGTSGTDAVNVAFHPEAIKVGYRTSIEQVQGTMLAQSTDPITGITIFAETSGYEDSNGVGNKVKFYVVAGVETVYDAWGVQILG